MLVVRTEELIVFIFCFIIQSTKSNRSILLVVLEYCTCLELRNPRFPFQAVMQGWRRLHRRFPWRLSLIGHLSPVWGWLCRINHFPAADFFETPSLETSPTWILFFLLSRACSRAEPPLWSTQLTLSCLAYTGCRCFFSLIAGKLALLLVEGWFLFH